MYEFEHVASSPERNTLLFFSSDKLSGTFANRKYEEQSYLKKSENVRALSSNSIQNTTPL